MKLWLASWFSKKQTSNEELKNSKATENDGLLSAVFPQSTTKTGEDIPSPAISCNSAPKKPSERWCH